MTIDASTYWATVAQVTPVFGLGIVVELRRVLRTWTRSNRFLRTWQSVTSGIAAVLLIVSFNTAMSSLARGDDASPGYAVNLALSFAIGILILNPVLDIVAAANADWLIRLARLIAHPIAVPQQTVQIVQLRWLLQDNVAGALSLLELSERVVDVLMERIRTQDEAQSTMKAATSAAIAAVAGKEPSLTYDQQLAVKKTRLLTADITRETDTHEIDRDLDAALLDLREAWDRLVERVDRQTAMLERLRLIKDSQSESATEFLEEQLERVKKENESPAP